eukprot:TRINITY_DN3798_c0_g1_i1.p1 TRINITY_DN3798_c0_g1~~TRINITY_DN3798_c0_g1_i1.p1  ORF type:complete len:199 (+),score=96.89 TRINITY_DN3798_c0_g1_i1:131-727(+)
MLLSMQPQKRVLVYVAHGTEEIEATGVIDTLRRTNIHVTVASIESSLRVDCSRGVKIEADVLIHDCYKTDYDAIILPGGKGSEKLRDNTDVVQSVKRQIERGRLVGAICASPANVLAHHNLLVGKHATCYPALQNMLVEKGAILEADKRVVVDGNIITSQGPATTLEFALEFIRILLDADKAAEIGRALLVPQYLQQS